MFGYTYAQRQLIIFWLSVVYNVYSDFTAHYHNSSICVEDHHFLM